MELPRQRRARKNKYDKELYPQGVLDVIKSDYPDRYFTLTENLETIFSLETLFSKEEWADILSKSRLSYEQWINLKKQVFRRIK